MPERLFKKKNRNILIILGALFTSTGTLFFGINIFSHIKTLVYILASFSGIGASILISFWLEIYSKNALKTISISYIFSVISGSLIFTVVQFLHFIYAIVFTSLLPLLSSVLLLSDETINENYDIEETNENFLLPFRLILIIAVFYLASGLLQWIIFFKGYFPSSKLYWLSTTVYAISSCMAGFLIFRIPDFNLNNLYKPVLPLLGASFTLLPFAGKILTPLILGLFYNTAFAFFDFYTMCTICLFSSRVKKPIKLIAQGYFFITLFIFIGEFLPNRLVSTIPFMASKSDTVAISAAILMFVASVLIKEISVDSKEKESNFIIESNVDRSMLDLESFAKYYKLTLREKEILSLILSGRNNPYIRDSLNISNNTLKTHLRNIYTKLDVKNRQEAITLFNKFLESKNSKPSHTG
ncbi:response regulator transcription factor [Caldicellulosiruptor owensensis]|uniref:response regulator transcription factor n=1 Tax=Caldicellulosiruptor owensensis TaxID=55205 RepID=UPI0013051A00|nr:helix-turn-helix transcriptional regulator [Caldicellulosiruptor owensensis]